MRIFITKSFLKPKQLVINIVHNYLMRYFKTLSLLFAIVLFFSCNRGEKEIKIEQPVPVVPVHPSVQNDIEPVDESGERKIMPRDYTIDSTNSYSSFFFDSLSLEDYFSTNKISDSIRRRMLSFYNVRNYQYAWFSKDGLTEDARGFWNLHSFYTTYHNNKVLVDSALIKQFERLAANEDLPKDTQFTATNNNILQTELKLTHHYVVYTLLNYDQGYLQKSDLEYFIPGKKQEPMAMADSLVQYFRSAKYYGSVNKQYSMLKDYLVKYVDYKNNRNMPLVNAAVVSLDAGSAGPEVAGLKAYLREFNYLPLTDTSDVFDTLTLDAVKSLQMQLGYKPSGKLTAQQVKVLNITPEKRIEQILLNMNRAKWMVNLPSGRSITVNIPEFMLHVNEDSNKVWDMKVVVGKEGTNTVNFTGNLSTIVFSPYWNVPLSITKNEVMPGIRRRGNAYLKRQNMEIYGSWGNGIPRVRQKPGPKNSLGLVKFLFPNSYDIYFHDSPQKYLFNMEDRAYSHGCIRLAEPKKFAAYLLQNDTTYTNEVIDSLMHLGKEKYVRLKTNIPVLISYYTAWVDNNGALHFAKDIYKKDKALADKMFMKTEPKTNLPKPDTKESLATMEKNT